MYEPTFSVRVSSPNSFLWVCVVPVGDLNHIVRILFLETIGKVNKAIFFLGNFHMSV